MIYSGLLDLVGNTPTVQLRSEATTEPAHLFAKLEGYNPTGSTKDRPAAYIIRKLLLSGELRRGATVVESSSGNFGVALAAVCRAEGLRFVCVVDPLLLAHNRFLLEQYGAEISQVDTRDDSGGYLKGRIARVQEIVESTCGALWINQYANEGNARAHYFGTGMEIYKAFVDQGLDYVFVPVSSGGTIAGVSQLLKQLFPQVQIIAVDTSGSVIFGGPPGKRHIPGMGSSIRPDNLQRAQIDRVVMVDEEDIVRGCLELLHRFGLFVGGSSGAAYCAAKQLLNDPQFVPIVSREYPQWRAHQREKPNVLLLFPDRGDRYGATLYSREWVTQTFPRLAGAELLRRAPSDTAVLSIGASTSKGPRAAQGAKV
ncbi:2,3-diaminopropionate biosynthesis protein SbnA [Pendulispora albinea]|uniref:2,3-diaminopropionate biosynthesis protein SbnA n=1 Tax=Pendulispora albinea TaxID=2741071 RepID=A0ABZ2MB92_9BACT